MGRARRRRRAGKASQKPKRKATKRGSALWRWTKRIFGSLLVLVLIGVSSLAGANTLLQSLSPDNLRGRVVSLYVTVSLGMTIFGSLLAGTGATYLGAPLTVGIGGLATIASAVMFYNRLPAIRRHIRRHRLFAPEEVTAT